MELFVSGAPHDERAPDAATYLTGKDVELEVDLGTGGAGASRMWTCDLSAEYVTHQRRVSNVMSAYDYRGST